MKWDCTGRCRVGSPEPSRPSASIKSSQEAEQLAWLGSRIEGGGRVVRAEQRAVEGSPPG